MFIEIAKSGGQMGNWWAQMLVGRVKKSKDEKSLKIPQTQKQTVKANVYGPK